MKKCYGMIIAKELLGTTICKNWNSNFVQQHAIKSNLVWQLAKISGPVQRFAKKEKDTRYISRDDCDNH